jgi:hypothetical protein
VPSLAVTLAAAFGGDVMIGCPMPQATADPG